MLLKFNRNWSGLVGRMRHVMSALSLSLSNKEEKQNLNKMLILNFHLNITGITALTIRPLTPYKLLHKSKLPDLRSLYTRHSSADCFAKKYLRVVMISSRSSLIINL